MQDDDNPDDNDLNLTQWGKGPSAGETKRKLKPRRLLMEICDGQTELKALEWKPIQELSGMVFPGAKVTFKFQNGPFKIKLFVFLDGHQRSDRVQKWNSDARPRSC